MKKTLLYSACAVLMTIAPRYAAAQIIYGNVYGGGELAQVTEPNADSVQNHIIQDADLATLFTKKHTYTTHVYLGEGAEVYGRAFGGGKGHEDSLGESAGRVVGQTDVILDGATIWSEIYGGGEMADVRGNTLVHFKKGKAGHNAYGGGLGKLTEKTDTHGNLEPDNRQDVLASADIKLIPANYALLDNLNALRDLDLNNPANWMSAKKTGESFVVFDGKEEGGTETYTHYEFEKERTVNRDAQGKPILIDGKYYTETDQFDANRPDKLFSINHNIYGGGMTASKVEGKTFVHINYGMVNEAMMNFKHEGKSVWSMVYNSIANAQFCVFGGGYGYHTDILGDTYVTMDIQGDGTYKYFNQFMNWLNNEGESKYHWSATNDPDSIAKAADEATWSHGAPGRSCMDIVGGGYNGKVLGSTHITVRGDVVLRKIYGGGYYSSVGHTDVTVESGIFNRVYGGGMIGNVYGKANMTIGQMGGAEVRNDNLHLLVKNAVYGGNDVSGTIGTSEPVDQEDPITHVHYNVFSPVDDDAHGVRLNMYGGLVLGDVYGAGNGNHPGYGNPNYMQFDLSQHPSENYRKVVVEGQTEMTADNYAWVYKYRPRVGRVVMNLQGNAGTDFNDNMEVDKLRIWGRTFGGGNSCNVGIWDGTADDNAEVYADDATSWHPGDNFMGGGSIRMNIGDHVQLGSRNDSHDKPNGLFMGSNGEHMITQHLDTTEARYYHQYYDKTAKKYYPGFVVYEDDAVTPINRSVGLKAFTAFINNILTRSDSVNLKVANGVNDVWMSNFVGGGYRGSMQALTHTGQFRYELPQGVTVGHSVVGGAFNAHIIYRVYATNYGDGTYRRDAEGNYLYETIEPAGGVVSKAEADSIDKAKGLTPGSTPYDYIKKLYADGHEGDEEYKVAYLRYNFDGGILAHDSKQNATNKGSRCHQIGATGKDDFTSNDGYISRQDSAILYLKLQNRLHPIVHEATDSTPLNIHGGIVYGGCFLSGFVDGDTWLDYDCSLSPLCTNQRFFDQTNDSVYVEANDIERNNALNIFGAGYGEDTHSMGDVYLYICARGHNNLYPFIYNAFGGSNLGSVAGSTNVYYNGGKQGVILGSIYGGGYKGDIAHNTYVELVQGFLMNVYGGSRQANIGGASHVWAYDGSVRPINGIADDQFNHLIICNLYGGNDISGTISGTMPATEPQQLWTDLQNRTFNSYIKVADAQPGTKGFPLIGSLYGGGNGEQWTDSLGAAPNVANVLLEIDGGTTLRAFGGGNKAMVTDSVYIFTNATNNTFADVTFAPFQKHIMEQFFFNGMLSGYTWTGSQKSRLQMDDNHVYRLFGGNNVAEMNIQPNWNLMNGKLGSVYAGGNLGNMTTPDGLTINVESPTVEIDNLFGGCRMANVQAIRYNKDSEGTITSIDTLTFDDNHYGATANVAGGRVHNIYGGNDVAGKVYNGTNVNITGGTIDNVYGAGNGEYIYQYNTNQDAPEIGLIVEKRHTDDEGNADYNYYTFRGDKDKTSAMDKIKAINAIRPNVDKTYLYLQGTESDSVMIIGNVYCGGNATTVCGAGAFTKLDIGSYCTLEGVYMGSNGEQMATTEDLDHLCQVNNMRMNTNGLLFEYMSAVAMPALPRGFALSDTITNTRIGTFCLGGNRGSMTSDQPIHITLPKSLVIYKKVVGGCNNAYLSYGGYFTTGGFITYNHDSIRSLPKICLNIYSKFKPAKLNPNTLKWESTVDRKGLLDGKYCNVYGGCYTRGCIYGDVEINMYSDMVGDFDQTVLAKTIAYNETHSRPVFSIFGGGYGPQTIVYGNTHIRLLNNNNRLGGEAGTETVQHPSTNAIYGGGEQGKMIGTSTIHVADGTVYSNVVGGALNGSIYGNTEILIGYPGYWEVQKTGEYKLKRSNFTEEELQLLDGSDRPAVKQSIFLLKDDRINAALYQAIQDWDPAQVDEANIKRVENKVSKNWNDIHIDIKGGIYGGGYARENVEDGQTAMANTVLKFTSIYNLATSHPELWTADNTLSGKDINLVGEYVYGGNATIWVQDQVNALNWEQISTKKEHITISKEIDPIAHTGVGGIFGDGHSSLVASFRSAALEGYGYAEHTADSAKLLNTFQRFDILQIRDCAMKMYGEIDVATGQNDPMLYSVSRISELMLNSRIDDSRDLKKTNLLNSRNVIAFYNPVHYLGSITSEVTFKPGNLGSRYHDIDGKVDALHSYYDYKSDSIAQNYDYSSNGIHAQTGCKEKFGKRNAGTAKNMIRIDDPEGRGVHLKVVQENNFAINAQGVREEQSFYGPLSGVFEFALTHVNARGGGYVYSNNLHQQTIAQSNALYPGLHPESESFLQTSGNVFFVPVYLKDRDQDRYVYDDCYPIPFSDRGDGELEKAHYWFVEGDGPTWCSYPQKPKNIVNETIHISTAEELAWIYDYIDHGYDINKPEDEKSTNDEFPGGFEGMTILLDNDINLEQLTILDQREVRMLWCPIADQKNTYFKGTFDGDGHKIDGMLLDVDFITQLSTYGYTKDYANDYDHYFGLFAKTKNAVVKNVNLTAALVRNSGGNENEMVHIGTLITQVDGTEVMDCSVELMDTVNTTQSNAVQAVAAFICHTDGQASTIHRNFVTGSIEANASAVSAPVSGFISRLDNGSIIEHCYSLVDVHAQQVAGLADTITGGAFLEHSYYAGTLNRTDNSTNWGAILANAGLANVKHCYYDKVKNAEAGGYRGSNSNVFKQDDGYTNWSTFGLTTGEMTSAASGDVWRSCYDHGHTASGETHPCEIDGDTQEMQAHTSAWNKGVWTYLPGLYPFLKSQDLNCSALTTAYVMPSVTSLGLTAWDDVNQHFQLPAYGTMYWSVENNTLLLDGVSHSNADLVDAHLFLGGPDVLSINCDNYHRQMQEIYVTRVDINSPNDTAWLANLSRDAIEEMGAQLHVDSITRGMLRNKEITNVSKKNAKGQYLENGFDGDLFVWNREGDAGTVTNQRQYTVKGNITYYTGYDNPYLWHEVNLPFDLRSSDAVTVYRFRTDSEYGILARNSSLNEDEDGGNFWLRSFKDNEVRFGGSVFQQAWVDPMTNGENYGHRPSIIRFPKIMKVDDTKYLSGDYWCYNQNNNIDDTEYNNGGSQIRFHSASNQRIDGTLDYIEDKRGIDDGNNFVVYGNPTLGNIQLEGYYWILESEKRDTAGVDDPEVRPEYKTDVAQWFSLQQDPIIKPLGIWLDGPENFKQQALEQGGSNVAPLRLLGLHEPGANEMYNKKAASFTASGRDGILGVFSYIDQDIYIYDSTGHLMRTVPVRANTGFSLNLPNTLFLVCGSNSSKQVKVLL